jgi:hypothetical protein
MSLLRTVFMLLICGLSLSVEARDYGCSHSSSELRCVIRFYPAIYRNDPEYFWKVLNRSQDNALSCDSVQLTIDFLRIVRLPTPGADLEEFISESVESLCVKQPVCFKQAIGMLDEKTRRAIKTKLETPLYYESSEISACYP